MTMFSAAAKAISLSPLLDDTSRLNLPIVGVEVTKHNFDIAALIGLIQELRK